MKHGQIVRHPDGHTKHGVFIEMHFNSDDKSPEILTMPEGHCLDETHKNMCDMCVQLRKFEFNPEKPHIIFKMGTGVGVFYL